MLIFKTQKDLLFYLEKVHKKDLTLGFVPTMGALHDGHLSLIKAAKNENAVTVCSIFVNPTQFNDANDLANYPQPIEKDLILLQDINCDVVFIPNQEEMYPDGTSIKDINYDLGYIDTVLEASKRPGHFQGVAHIMTHLLQLIQPTHLYMGQKDYQQCLVIKKIIENNHWDIHLKVMPIIREDDGLALSSRNQRLNEFERAKAGLLYQCLISIKAKKHLNSFGIMAKESKELMEKKGLKVEYIALADANNFTQLDEFSDSKDMVVLIAAFLGDVRLIDNILL